VVRRFVFDPQRLAEVMVEDQVRAGHVREVRRDVLAGDLDLAVLHVFRVDELDLVHHAELLQEHGAYETVEVAARDQSILGFHRSPRYRRDAARGAENRHSHRRRVPHLVTSGTMTNSRSPKQPRYETPVPRHGS